MDQLTDEQREARIKALLRERAGAEQRGRADTVREIDRQLAELGAQGAPPVKRATRRRRAT